MAEQATVKRAASAAPVPKKNGRPPGSRSAPKTKVFDFDAPKRDFQKPEDFFAYLDGYPDKTALLISVYRLKPKIDHSLVGINQSAILQTPNAAEVTEEAIGDTFGRGKYMLKLNDSNKAKGQQLRCRAWLDITDVEKPPQYDPRTLCLGEAQNQDEIMRLLNAGVLVRDAHGAPRLRGENDPLPIAAMPAHPQQNGQQSSELFGRDVMGQIVLAALKQGTQNPHDVVKDTIEVARLLNPPAAVDVESIVERVISRLQPAAAAPVEPLDVFSQFERWEGFIKRIRGDAPAVSAGDGLPIAASEPGVSWAPHLSGILAQARALIPEALAAYRSLQTERAAVPPQFQQQQVQPMTIQQRIEEIALLGFQQMTQGVQGWDFAAYVCTMHPDGLEVYKTLEQMGGALAVIGLAAMNPATRPLVNDLKVRPQLEAFLAEFFTFDPDGSEETPPSPVVPAPAPPSRAGSKAS